MKRIPRLRAQARHEPNDGTRGRSTRTHAQSPSRLRRMTRVGYPVIAGAAAKVVVSAARAKQPPKRERASIQADSEFRRVSGRTSAMSRKNARKRCENKVGVSWGMCRIGRSAQKNLTPRPLSQNGMEETRFGAGLGERFFSFEPSSHFVRRLNFLNQPTGHHLRFVRKNGLSSAEGSPSCFRTKRA
jgi:hypothetical protein